MSPKPRPTTALTHEGCGSVVEGSVKSVALVLNDAKRHNEPAAWFRTPSGGTVEVATDVPWEIEEVEAG